MGDLAVGIGTGLGGGDLGAAGTDISGDLGQALSAGFDSVDGGSPGGEGGHVPAPGGEPPVEVPPGEAPTPPQDAQPAQPADAASPYPVSQDGKSYLVPKADLPALTSARDYSAKVQEWFPDAEAAHLAHLQSSDSRIMQNDWLDGSDDALQGFLNHWMGGNHGHNPAVQARMQQSFVRMAQMIPDTLSRVSPQAFAQFIGSPARFDAQGGQISPASGLLLKAVEAAYVRAGETGNPEDFKRAQELDYGITGTYKNELPRVDPQARARDEFSQREAAFNQRQGAALKRDVAAFNTAQLEGAKFDALRGEIRKLLEPIKAKYPAPTFEAVQSAIFNEALQSVQKDAEFWIEHKQEFDNLIRDYRTGWERGDATGNSLRPRIDAYRASFIQKASRLLPSIVQKHIGSATVAQTRPRNPNGTFAPPPAPNPAPAAMQVPSNGNSATNGRVSRDDWNRELREALTVR